MNIPHNYDESGRCIVCHYTEEHINHWYGVSNNVDWLICYNVPWYKWVWNKLVEGCKR